MKISFIIPAYNEKENIIPTISSIEQELEKSSPKPDYEIIVIDDHSSDNTFDTLEQKKLPNVSILRLSRRSGSHVALRAGLNTANGDAAICMAADGQDAPTTILDLLNQWQNGNEIVWALRKNRDDETFLSKSFANIFYYLLTKFNKSDSEIDLSRADFYLLDKKVIGAINSCQEKNTSLFGLIIWLGFNQSFVEYERPSRRFGKSKWNFKSKMALAKDWILAFSGIPLRLLTYSGFFIAGIGFIYALFIVSHSIINKSPVPGWSSVMTITLLLGGGQAIMLGIIGEYLWRTMDEARKRPIYFIQKIHLAKSSNDNNAL